MTDALSLLDPAPVRAAFRRGILTRLNLGTRAIAALVAGAFLWAGLGGTAAAEEDYWAGPYYGMIGGYAMGTADITFNTAGHYNTNPGDSFTVDLRRIPLGGVMGFNWMRGNMMLGVEASVHTHTVRIDDLDGPDSIHLGDHSYFLKTHWVGAFLGRIGYASGRWLLYAEGGLGMAHPIMHIVDNDNGYLSYANPTRPTLLAGAGVQMAFGPRFSVGLGYRGYWVAPLRVTGNSVDFAGDEVGGTESDHTVQYTTHTLLARVIYRYGQSERYESWDHAFDWDRRYWGTIGSTQHQLGIRFGFDRTVGQTLMGANVRAGAIAWGNWRPDAAITTRVGHLIEDRLLVYANLSLGIRFGDVGAELPVYWDLFEGLYFGVGAGFELALTPRMSAFTETQLMWSPAAGTTEGNFYTGFNFTIGR